MSNGTKNLRYPRIHRRLRAAIVDSVILLVAFFGSAMSVSNLEVHGGFKFAIVAAVIFVLEPGLVFATGATIGHRLLGLRVRNANYDRNIGVLRATVRFSVKMLFGFPSLVFVLITKRHQAIHDILTGSLVVLGNQLNEDGQEALPERTNDYLNYDYPSKIRRIIVIIIYWLIFSYPLMEVGDRSLSIACLEADSCNSKESWILTFVGFGMITILAISIVLGWQGLLWGCRRKLRNSREASPA